MQIIVLHTIHYVSYNGITLSKYNPFVEATPENVAKLSKFITAGYLKVVEESEVSEEEKTPQNIPEIQEEVQQDSEEMQEIVSPVKRGYDESELVDKTKNEIMDILKEEGIEFKTSMKKEELIDLLVG